MHGRHRGALAALLCAAAIGVPSTRPTAHADDVDVVISEFMASNTSTLFDEGGSASDWVEIWNRGSSAVDLAGWHLTDSASNLTKWEFPAVSVPPAGFLVVFASDDNEIYPLHTNFRLSAGGEYLGLTDPDGDVVSEYAPTFPPQLVDVSYGIGSGDNVGYLLRPTPGAPNEEAGEGVAATPTLSHYGGWLDGPTQVSATTNVLGATMYYTTDGSLPTTTNGTAYTGPIDVTGSMMLRVVATRPNWFDSPPASATFFSLADVVAQVGQPAGWPTGPVNGQVYDYGFAPGLTPSEVDAVEAALLAAPVMNVQADQAHFTDPVTGIYSNPEQSGSGWERPASIDFVDQASGTQFHRAAGVRIKGGFSRAPENPKHSLRLTFGPQYSGLLTAPIFGADGVQTFDALDLRSEQNHSWHLGSDRNTMLRDVWLRDTQAATGHRATRSRWTHLFLNGLYWGVYMLTERITDHFAAQQWGGSASDYDVIKHGDDFQSEVSKGDDEEWLQLWGPIADGYVTDEEYQLLTTLVDLPNLIDSRLIDMVAGNLDTAPNIWLDDFLANNWYAVGGDGVPFRFFLHDGEHTLGAFDHDPQIDRTGPFPLVTDSGLWTPLYFHPGWLHGVLLSHPDYKILVRDRVAALLAPDGALATTASVQRWEARKAEVSPLLIAEAARWGDASGTVVGVADWEAEVAWVETEWFPTRTEVVIRQLALDGLVGLPIEGEGDGPYAPAERLGPVE